MAVIGGFRSDLSIHVRLTEILETFPRVFCSPESHINGNGGNEQYLITPFYNLFSKFSGSQPLLLSLGCRQSSIILLLDCEWPANDRLL